MRLPGSFHRPIAALLCSVLACGMGLAVPAHASSPLTAQLATQRAATLDRLFSDLRAARDQTEADAVTTRIWHAWAQSGRDDVDVLLSKATASIAGRHFGLARLLLDEIVDLAPDFAEGWNKRAALLYHMGLHADALSDLDTALRLEPRHFGALAARAAIHADTGRWKEALEAYRAALAINPFLASRYKVLPELERRSARQVQ
jgi:tetratricopeptide (TPR) repeat protein